MTKPDRPQSPNCVPVHCSSKTTPNGNHIMLCEIGFNSSGQSGVFLWCKCCHESHFLGLAQITATLQEIAEHGILDKAKQQGHVHRQLVLLQQRLEIIGAHDESMALVEKLLGHPETMQQSTINVTQIQVIKHMMRLPEVIDNYHIYNDLQELIGSRHQTETAIY